MSGTNPTFLIYVLWLERDIFYLKYITESLKLIFIVAKYTVSTNETELIPNKVQRMFALNTTMKSYVLL